MLNNEWSTFGKVNFKIFYWNRFRRLFPALMLVVIFSAIVSPLFLSPLGQLQVAIKTQLGAMLMMANQVIASSTEGGILSTLTSLFEPLESYLNI